jgi:hypothetical protein
MRVTIPHSLTRVEARKRIKAGTSELAGFIPGASGLRQEWQGEDHLALDIAIMGAKIGAGVDIEDHQIVIDVDLPVSLALLSGPIKNAIRDKSTKLLT